MNQERETENYIGFILDKANELGIEPQFLDVLVTALATGLPVSERAFLTSYFVRLARSFMADSETALKSHRTDVVQAGKVGLSELNEDDLRGLDRELEVILKTGLSMMEGDGSIRYNHLVALDMAIEHIEEQKACYGKQDFDSLVNDVLLEHLEPMIKFKQRVLLEDFVRKLQDSGSAF